MTVFSLDSNDNNSPHACLYPTRKVGFENIYCAGFGGDGVLRSNRSEDSSTRRSTQVP